MIFWSKTKMSDCRAIDACIFVRAFMLLLSSFFFVFFFFVVDSRIWWNEIMIQLIHLIVHHIVSTSKRRLNYTCWKKAKKEVCDTLVLYIKTDEEEAKQKKSTTTKTNGTCCLLGTSCNLVHVSAELSIAPHTNTYAVKLTHLRSFSWQLK